MQRIEDLYAVFETKPQRYIRVTPEGFLVDSRVHEVLVVRIQDEQVMRKLWQHQKVVCWSPDGIRAKNGKLCRACKDLKRCTPQLVLYFEFEDEAYRLPLGYTSGRNYLTYRKELETRGLLPLNVLNRLSVVRRGQWGEVVFHRVSEDQNEGPV